MFLKRFFQQKSRAIQETAFYERVSLQSPSNVERLRGIQHSMGLVLDMRFHIWFTRDRYYKMRQLFYYKIQQFCYKMRQLLQIATILLQNATFIANCDSTNAINWNDSPLWNQLAMF